MTRHHPLDGNAIAADAYYDRPDPVGTREGETCGRYGEPDEDAPRGYRPRPCGGVMRGEDDNEGKIVCDTCGERANDL